MCLHKVTYISKLDRKQIVSKRVWVLLGFFSSSLLLRLVIV